MRRKQTGSARVAHHGPPERWLSAPDGGDAPADRLAALIRAGEAAGGLGPVGRARVWARLTQARPAFPWRGPIGLRWAVAVIVLLTSGVVIGAVTAHRFWPPPVAQADAPATDDAPARRRPKSTRPAHPRGAPAEAAPVDEATRAGAANETASVATAPAPPTAAAAPPPVPARTPAPIPARSPSSAARFVARPVAIAMTAPPAAAAVPPHAPAPPPALAPPPATTPSTLSAETELLREAVTRLRQRGDATRALAALDVYDERFPRGTLRREADAARVDALLLLGRDDEALGVLRTLTLRPQGRDQELQVIRGELLAPGRCARAIADFDAVLAQSPPAALAERALYGRAACRLRQRDGAAARDLQDYLRRFPDGQFAPDARRAVRENGL